MKKLVVLTAVLLSTFLTAFANESNNRNTTVDSRYGFNRPFMFNERGVEFFVFPNGEFDFNTHPTHFRGRRTSINTTYGAPGRRRGHYYHNSGIRIEHDHLGRVRRVGNVFINYDRSGRVKRVGSVYMRYNHRLLNQIGGMHIAYDCYGRIIRTTGYIKYNSGCNVCGVTSCGINHNDYYSGPDYDFDDDGYYGNDDDMYYYRNNGKKKDKKSSNRR
ncbi:hypothetical protein [Pseudofulvibacter geojedonensis]|uniref:Uncharacterized protein n=1 Tax=Pseudofulvibacter geojedonensis TaxID=1123758 RepID=A0ABW3I1Y8_9FLAO